MEIKVKPYDVTIYLFGFLKRGGAILNIPVRCKKKPFVKKWLAHYGFRINWYRIKIKPITKDEK